MANPVKIQLDTKVLDEIIKQVGNVETDKWVISDSVEYGVFVEFGTKRMPARPTLTPAFEDVTKDLPEGVGQAIEKQININDVLAAFASNIEAKWKANFQNFSKPPIDTGAYRNGIKARKE